jgi:hypothetical protein
MKDKQSLRGVFSLQVWKGDKLVEQYEDNNLIVNNGRNFIAQLVGGTVTGQIDQIGFGTDGTAPALADVELTAAFKKNVGGAALVPVGRMAISWTLDPSEANGMTIREFGLFYNNGGVLVARKTREPIVKTSDVRLTGTWTLIF